MSTKIRKGSAYSYLIANNKEFECEICHNSEWNGKPIPLEVHHIDGNHNNNDNSNIQILCPNCHAQTDTYKAKNRKETKEIYYCKRCGKQLWGKTSTGLCRECFLDEESKQSKIPEKEELENAMKIYKSYSSIGKVYGVSDKTIKKWCIKYDISKLKNKFEF